jgi:hypothetical protein
MLMAIRIALALELLLICCEGALPQLGGYLPIGGSEIAQVGISLGLSVVVTELRSAWGELAGGREKNAQEKPTGSESSKP